MSNGVWSWVSPVLAQGRETLRERGLARQLVSAAFGNLALSLTATFSNLLIAAVLARMLGASGFGVYALATAWSLVLTVPALLGLPPLVIRNVAEYHVAQSWSFLRGLLRRTDQVVLGASLLAALVGCGIGWLADGGKPEQVHAIWLALLLVPLVGLASVRQSAMQGLGRLVLSRVPIALVTPLLFLAAVALARLLIGPLSPLDAVALSVVAAAVALALGEVMLRRSLPLESRRSAPSYESRVWLRSALPLILFSGIQGFSGQASIILLGLLKTSADTGIYSASSRAASVVGFLYITMRFPVAPTVARLYASRDLERLQQVVTRSAQGTFFLTLPIALGMLVFARPLLHLFGSGFGDGTTALRILSLGQVVNVLTGVAGIVLLMTGHERKMTAGVAIGAVIGIVLNLALIPFWGILGAAIGTAIGGAISNVLLVHFAWRTVRIYAPAVRLPGFAR